MNIDLSSKRLPFYFGTAFLICIVAVIFITILRLNAGHFVYTLDDPYIHLSLAQHILQGHYGINATEFSAPSSSILWPFILAPFSSSIYFPLIINICAAVATTFLFVKIIQTRVPYNNTATTLFITALVILLQLSTNMIWLIFTGMEQSLQVFFVALIAYGLVVTIENKNAPPWLFAAIILAPLIRYECLTVSGVALLFLFLNKYRKRTLLSAVILIICIGGFSLFLSSLGLGLMPSSILAKSNVVQGSGLFQHICLNLRASIFVQRQGLMLLILATLLIGHNIPTKNKEEKLLSIMTVLAILGHFAFGKYGGYYRYEIYIVVFSLLISLFLWLPTIVQLYRANRKIAAVLFAGAIGVFIVVLGYPYMSKLPMTSIAANNIYEQQYQMHRFATQYYKQPVAVNDLGYVSYNNKNYVLDLWGLGSREALTYRKGKFHKDWIRKLCKEYDVKLIMIYDRWFRDTPHHFFKIGELHLGRQRITPARSDVGFYVTNRQAATKITQELREFSKTLPPGVTFTFATS